MSNGTRTFEIENVGVRKGDACAAIHRFERCGLGKAPFRVTGFGRHVFQAIPGDPSCPLQPGTSCDYCGTGCMDVANVTSSDGKHFKVGLDCAAKVGDAGLVAAIKKSQEYRKLQRDKRYARAEVVKAEVTRLMSDASVRAKLGDIEVMLIENSLKYSGMAGYARNYSRIKKQIRDRPAHG